jgi:hypothetical protein
VKGVFLNVVQWLSLWGVIGVYAVLCGFLLIAPVLRIFLVKKQ